MLPRSGGCLVDRYRPRRPYRGSVWRARRRRSLTHAIVSGEGERYVAEVMTVVRRAPGRRASRTSTALTW